VAHFAGAGRYFYLLKGGHSIGGEHSTTERFNLLILKKGTFMQFFETKNGVNIPHIGFGTWAVSEGEETIKSIIMALEAGYRHIDTAMAYKNEKSIGIALKDSKLKRQEYFVTSKVWNNYRGYDKTKEAFYLSLESLNLDYLDMYLIHWPCSIQHTSEFDAVNADTWKALCDLYDEKLIRVIGVSNFKERHLKPLMSSNIKPMVNQIEYHPGYIQKDVVKYCREHEILVEAWSPMGRGRILEHPLLKEIAKKYSKSIAQICLRFCLDTNVLPLPKSVTPERIKENLDIDDFILDDADLLAITNMEECGWSNLDPDTITF